MKTCSRCGKKKSHADFQLMRSSRDGKRPECKSCSAKASVVFRSKWSARLKERRKIWYEKYKDKIMERHREYRAADPDKIYRMYRRYRKRNAEKIAAWWKKSPRGRFNILLKFALKRRPAKNAITVDGLMELWASQGGKCALSGVDMTWGQGKTTPTSISIDRIDCARGYERSNIRLVCYQANVFRNRWSDDQMLAMAKAIVATMDKPQPHYLLSEAA